MSDGDLKEIEKTNSTKHRPLIGSREAPCSSRSKEMPAKARPKKD